MQAQIAMSGELVGEEKAKVKAKPSETQDRTSVSLVIPAWNKSADVELMSYKALRSVFQFVDRSKMDLKIVVVDNDSPMKTDWGMIMVSLGERFDVVKLKENRGFGPATNLGACVHPRTEYVAQMNTDCELVEDSLSILIGAMKEHHLDVGMPEHLENCRHYGVGKSDEVMGSDWRFGAFWVMTRKMWDAASGFDESFEMCYWEDSDLWRRIESLGGKIGGWRGTWVSHVGGASSHEDRDKFFAANRALYERRWNVPHEERPA